MPPFWTLTPEIGVRPSPTVCALYASRSATETSRTTSVGGASVIRLAVTVMAGSGKTSGDRLDSAGGSSARTAWQGRPTPSVTIAATAGRRRSVAFRAKTVVDLTMTPPLPGPVAADGSRSTIR